MVKASIIWFRQDLRLEDHPALWAALEKGGAIIPLFIWDAEQGDEWRIGAASRWWLHHSLQGLKAGLKKLGLTLIVRQGKPLDEIFSVISRTGADAVYWNRLYEPFMIQQDAVIKAELLKQGIKAQSFNGSLLFEPWTVANKQGKPFQVFTFFWKQCLKLEEVGLPLPAPQSAKRYLGKIESCTIESLDLLPRIKWDSGLEKAWRPGFIEARCLIEKGVEVIGDYAKSRDRPDFAGTTLLSPSLHFGEVSPRMVWQAVKEKHDLNREGAEAYLRQLGWREFAHHLLYHFPQTPQEPLKKQFKAFSWKSDKQALKAWQRGKTGYPIVDAGMRQLWETGWMHNRVRLITASFLVKDLLIDWLEGAKWFWDTLVDADLANNTLGWQWVAGCGADAAPYFRVFNPITQGEKFDPEGEYVRRWVPELRHLPNKWIHRPWQAPEGVLVQAGVQIGVDYPTPVVDHAEARKQALDAYRRL
ncbi:Putative photolyase [Candidatus Protochlamydia naegleriophila]|uniref:Deoxyribodipyrimidine photo-lyase n=1 Tax=Candidatus Protochlamydia naegleriophila TaxID=389348 RepID=A0A0U5JH61_9BACT|nr:deoxyribodipyrimidine photo-lyase [Candidatus Protochlamydia naegleriophila]CUI17126.1 Putative photolyase [Candidatus Protochlamydia naegleriophila]